MFSPVTKCDYLDLQGQRLPLGLESGVQQACRDHKARHVALTGVHTCPHSPPASLEMPKSTLHNHFAAAELVLKQLLPGNQQMALSARVAVGRQSLLSGGIVIPSTWMSDMPKANSLHSISLGRRKLLNNKSSCTLSDQPAFVCEKQP